MTGVTGHDGPHPFAELLRFGCARVCQTQNEAGVKGPGRVTGPRILCTLRVVFCLTVPQNKSCSASVFVRFLCVELGEEKFFRFFLWAEQTNKKVGSETAKQSSITRSLHNFRSRILSKTKTSHYFYVEIAFWEGSRRFQLLGPF